MLIRDEIYRHDATAPHEIIGLLNQSPSRRANGRGHDPRRIISMSTAQASATVYHQPDLRRIVDRIVIRLDGCWSWDGPRVRGYASCKFAGRTHRVHRLLFSEWCEDPGERHLHHRCEHKWCVNPWHLVPLTPQEHADEHLKTHCPQGHEYAGDNLYVNPQGFRECRACHRERKRNAWRRKHGVPLDKPVRGAKP